MGFWAKTKKKEKKSEQKERLFRKFVEKPKSPQKIKQITFSESNSTGELLKSNKELP